MANSKTRIISFVLIVALFLSIIVPMRISPAKAADYEVYDISFTNTTYGDDTTGIDFGRAGDQWKRAQTFVALDGGNISSVEAKVIAIENPGDLVAELYACDLLGGVTGDALASATVSKTLISGSSFTEVSIPLEYDGLVPGKMYAVMLSQTTQDGWYGWYCSFDLSIGEWWNPSVYNPQIKQAGYDGDLPSYRFADWGESYDDSRCGDLWLKVNYSVSDKAYDLSFENSSYNSDSTGIDFGRSDGGGSDQWKRGQTFVALEGGDIQSIEAKVIAVNNPGDLTAELYAVDSGGNPAGDPLAEASVEKEMISSDIFTQVNIPITYEGMIPGNKYVLILGQASDSGWYGWYCSHDVSNPDWWRPEVTNPLIQQPGYGGSLLSFKVTESGEIMDDTRCGNLWIKVRYIAESEIEKEGPEESLEAIYRQDMENGGLSFYIDRVLARPGVDPSLKEDSGIMTRGRALYTKGTNDSGLIKEFGFGGVMRYVKDDQSGYTIRVNGQAAGDFSENTSKRVDYPSYWTSQYSGKSGSSNQDLEIETKRFITENNTAVTILEITNNSQSEKTAILSMNVPSHNSIDENMLMGNISVDGCDVITKASLDEGIVKNGELERTLTIPAGESVSVKAQMGYINPNDAVTEDEYSAYSSYMPEEAFAKHVQKYNYWWVENIPYMWVSDPVIQKMTIYRWWITRTNAVDAGTANYPFPTAMEGIFGYNNAIINAVPWQMDELRYLRSPLLEYGTWADAVFAASGGIYKDNPAGVWGVKPQHYISKAGWESYKVHGGQLEFLNAMANAGAGDVDGTQKNFDPDGDFLYGIQYDAWDNDTASLAIGGNWDSQQRIDTASLAWSNAIAVSEMYLAAGDSVNAQKYKSFADNIKAANVANSWDSVTKQFLMKMTDTGAFNPFKDINNYYGFMVGMIPQNSGYDVALDIWGDEEEFPIWPMYVSNSKDFNTIQNNSQYNNRSRNYSPGNFAITLKFFSSAIKNYETTAITGNAFGELLKKYTEISYANKNLNYPDTNEFFNGNPDSPYRSWIHHNFHSQYNALIIENIMGITPRDDKIIELNPIDIGLEAFKLSELRYHESDLSVILDENGYRLLVDGGVVASFDRLCHFTWDSVTGEVEILDESGAAVLENNALSDFKSAYEVEYDSGRISEIMDAVVNYEPKESISIQNPPEHDGSYKLKTSNSSDWEDNFNLDFGDYLGDQFKRAQMFVATQGGIMTGVQVMIRNKTATKDVTVELCEAGTDNRPGAVLASATIPVSQISVTEMCVVTANFNYKLEKNKAYYIVLGQDTDGSGIYCWALSATNMSTGTQAYQEGYNGSLDMYMIKQDGSLVNENNLGDYYLEVFYKNESLASDFSKLQAAVDEADNMILPSYLTQEIADEFGSALKAAKDLLLNPDAYQDEIDNAEIRLKNSIKAVNEAEDPTSSNPESSVPSTGSNPESSVPSASSNSESSVPSASGNSESSVPSTSGNSENSVPSASGNSESSVPSASGNSSDPVNSTAEKVSSVPPVLSQSSDKAINPGTGETDNTVFALIILSISLAGAGLIIKVRRNKN